MEHTNSRKRASERGQSLVLLALAFVTLMIVVGLAVDLGLVYIEKVRLGRAVDAAALGGVPELPHEEAAFIRALMFLSDNGYDATNSAIVFNGEWQDWSLPSDGADIVLTVNTADYRELDEDDLPIENTAQRIRVEGVHAVPMNFMKFANVFGFDFDSVDVSGRAVAENVQNLDVSVVFDRSGSMEFDTICYGCWETVANRGYDYDHSQWSSYMYPGGVRHPMPYPNDLCPGGTEPMYRTDRDDNYYVIIEAEHYYQSLPPFDPDYRTSKTSYWALQRNDQGASAYSDNRGTYMQHNPFLVYPDDTEQVYDATELGQAPYLAYLFQVPETGTYRLWLRGQGGNNDYSGNVNSRELHWGLNGAYRDSASNHNYFGFQYGQMYEGARSDLWRWRRVDQFALTTGVTHTLQIFAGGAGFRLDKIVITSAPDLRASRELCNRTDCANTSTDVSEDATAGRSGWACWACNPLFGPPVPDGECEAIWDNNPVYQSMYDAMFDDKQPVRAAKEAIKLFLDPPQELENRLEPQFDQVGLVSYSSGSTIDSELECLVRLGSTCMGFDVVADAVEELNSSGNTNTGAALRDAVDVLSRDPGHYGRAGTRKFIILMTDGVPTANPGACPDLWPDGGRDYDCVIHYARQAAQNGIMIYTIGLGDSVDEPFLTAVADETDGTYFPAPDKDDLDEIFMQILSRIYIRLVN